MIGGTFTGQGRVTTQPTAARRVMPGFMQQYQRKRVCSQVGMKGKTSVQYDNALAGQPESLGIDDSKIQTKFECQVGKGAVHIRNEKLQ
jgi:hypothetical protein